MNTTLTAYEACFKKRLYWNKAEAEGRQWGRHGVDLNVYPCHIGNHGEHFHIGHKSARAESIQRLRTFGSQTLLTTK
jgi:hypothetical protein